MTVREEHIDITPDKSLMPKLGKAGYSFVQAISELVDNSIDARLEGQKLTVKVALTRSSIEILDDGKGMTRHEAGQCLRLAHSAKRDQLGEFGLGLKTSCLSLGKRFTIYTSSAGDQDSYRLDFDEDSWLGTADVGWSRFPLKVLRKRNADSHGTTVKVDKLKVRTLGRTTDLRTTLAVRFGPYISSGDVQIGVNNKTCRPVEPRLTEEGKTPFAFEAGGVRVDGWYGLLREGSQKGLYGFNTFRRGRLITAYAKMGFDPHPMVARISGEIHMNDVPVTHNKREWLTESPEFMAVERRLREVLGDLVQKARAKASEEHVGKNVKERTDLWMDKISEATRLPELRGYTQPTVPVGVATAERSTSDQDPLRVMDVERRNPPSDSGSHAQSDPERSRMPKRSQEKPVHVVEVKGRRFRFTHDFRPLGVQAPWKDFRWDSTVGLEIFTNTDFPAFIATNDRPYYAAYHVAESIAEILAKESNESEDSVDSLKQTILRKASSLMADLTSEAG